MHVFLYGEDAFRIHAHKQKLVARFQKERDPDGYNTVNVRAADVSESEVRELLFASPFLAPKRLVLIEGLLATDYTDTIKELLQKIESNTLPADTTVVFHETGAPKKAAAKKLFELLKTGTYAQEFSALKGREVVTFAEEEAKTQALVCGPRVAEELARRSGNDLYTISSTIAILSAYTNGRAATLSDLDLFLPDETGGDAIFALMDALTEKRAATVYKLLEEEYRAGKESAYILAMLARQFRLLLQVTDMRKRNPGITESQIAAETNIHSFVVKKLMVGLRYFSDDDLRQAHKTLITLDGSLKFGGDLRAELDVFLAKILAPR